MTPSILALSSAVVFAPGPGFIDLFNVPKMIVTSGAGMVAAVMLWVRHRSGERVDLPLFWPIVAFLAVTSLSAFAAVNVPAVYVRVSLDLVGFLLFWSAASLSVGTVKTVLRYLPLFVVPNVIIALYGFVWGLPWGGTFGNIEHGATVVAIGAAVAASVGGLHFGLAAAFLAFLVAGEARSTLIGLLAGMSLVAAVMFRQVALYVGLAVAAGLLIGVLFFRPSLSEWLRVGETRVEMWSTLVSRSVDKPVLGYGRGNFRYYSPAYAYSGFATGDQANEKQWFSWAHNDYLQLLFESGPVALALFLWILYQILWPLPLDLLAWGLFTGLVATMVQAWFLFPFELAAPSAWFWTSAGFYWRLKA